MHLVNDWLMRAVLTDMDTSAARDEEQNQSPWPSFIREQVWADRIKFRKLLKAGSQPHASFIQSHADAFTSSWAHDPTAAASSTQHLTLIDKQRLCTLTLPRLHKYVTSECGFDKPYQVVLQAVAEQIAHFELTQYGPDGIAHCPLYLIEPTSFLQV